MTQDISAAPTLPPTSEAFVRAPRASADTSSATAAWWERPATVVLVAAIVRAVALLLVEGESNDGTTRIGTAIKWFFGGQPTFGRTVWGEGNYVLPGVALRLWNDPFWSVRVAYALVGVVAVWIVMLVARRAFDVRSAALAGWLVALMPFHILTSVSGATSEGPYIVFIFGALLAVLRHREAPSAALAVAAGLSLALATTFRYDGVIWGIPLAASFVLWRPDEERAMRLDARAIVHLALFGVCGLLYVIAIFAKWSTLYDSPWYPLNQAKLNTLQFFGDGAHPRWPEWFYQLYVVLFWPAATFAILTPLVAAFGWLGAARAVGTQQRRALPLVFALVVTCLWLAYATFTHSILAQFRYALIIAVVLTAFVVPGVRALGAWGLRVSTRTAVVGALVIALAWQALVTDATLHDRGVLTNQLSLISVIRRSQFATREMLQWAATNTAPDKPLLVSPWVDSPYYALKRGPLVAENRVLPQSYYLPKSQLVHTRASLEAEMAKRIAASGAVATSVGTREIGLRDGLQRELVRPKREGDHYAWHGLSLAPVARWGDVRVWKVLGGTPTS